MEASLGAMRFKGRTDGQKIMSVYRDMLLKNTVAEIREKIR